MNVRIVVADEREAQFFDAVTLTSLTGRGTLVNEAGRMKDGELESDRPGSRSAGPSGAGHRHGVTGEKSTVQHELTLFAKEVAKRIDADRVKNEFDKLVLVAGPKMLGLLRQSLPTPSQSLLAAEVSKDLTHQSQAAILKALPGDAFFQ